MLPYHKDTDKIMPLNMPYIKGQDNATVHIQIVQDLPFAKMVLVESFLHILSMPSRNKTIKSHIDNSSKKRDMLLSTLAI